MLSDPWIDYDPRQVPLAAATTTIRYMLDRSQANEKRIFVKLTADDLGWYEVAPRPFLTMTAFMGLLDYDPTIVAKTGTVGDVWLGPGLGRICYYEKAGTGDDEWARISDYSGGAPAVTGAAGTQYLTDQGWAAFPGLGGLAVGTRVPGSFTLTDKQFSFVDGRLILSGTQRGTLSGDSRVQILGRR